MKRKTISLWGAYARIGAELERMDKLKQTRILRAELRAKRRAGRAP